MYPNQFISSQLPQPRRDKGVKCCKKNASSAQDMKPSEYMAMEIIPKWDEGISGFSIQHEAKMKGMPKCEF